MLLSRLDASTEHVIHEGLVALAVGPEPLQDIVVMTQADLLHYLGFSHGPWAFVPGRQCIEREIPADFDVPRFARTVDSAFSELETGIKLLFNCGFYVEHQLFGRRLPPVI